MSTTTLGISQFSFAGALGKIAAPAAPERHGNSFMAALIDSAEKQSREKARREALAAQAAKEIAEASARTAHQDTVNESADLPAVVRQLRPPAPVGPNPLFRAWSWLNRKYTLSTTKQLRVAETVSLGDKRFVAVVHVAGQKFLIGGGSQGVSLLTKLDDAGELQAETIASESGEPE
ncbi:MAG TPA: flagellar biosynthetic protein FliO [Acidobacteriaceae bacterium]|jgi:hypothetical protein|nr:flagellar biosynthetic protein FliO [Acidobacteriaceae bacterium]